MHRNEGAAPEQFCHNGVSHGLQVRMEAQSSAIPPQLPIKLKAVETEVVRWGEVQCQHIGISGRPSSDCRSTSVPRQILRRLQILDVVQCCAQALPLLHLGSLVIDERRFFLTSCSALVAPRPQPEPCCQPRRWRCWRCGSLKQWFVEVSTFCSELPQEQPGSCPIATSFALTERHLLATAACCHPDLPERRHSLRPCKRQVHV
mmetsp:Transcript_104148/g.334044  ORF Transcript_104148/g.334044 Transcript_104148/m.334044 type:complete len:204 (-) Transcript_104148:2428-3039(-)